MREIIEKSYEIGPDGSIITITRTHIANDAGVITHRGNPHREHLSPDHKDFKGTIALVVTGEVAKLRSQARALEVENADLRSRLKAAGEKLPVRGGAREK